VDKASCKANITTDIIAIADNVINETLHVQANVFPSLYLNKPLHIVFLWFPIFCLRSVSR